ncbi:hypothetical protein [Spiroplasma tabanidicola]|uniref:Uncharacterized protein n=1 Tax=Spiroplasma tabanidicola TaxID=324079 RepID=A0A6I6CDJ1_9MOLU|nr:hypothetical protein [Spiroplasma tabanidicola]QGS52044.1 hypothetical protein STABA_v1c06850 [Spiroplasma tabanidicola]
MVFLTETAKKSLSTNTLWMLFGIGIGLLIIGVLATIFFIKFKRIKKEAKDNFAVVTGIYKIFRFWQYYAIIIVALVGYVGSLILLTISIEGLVK